HDPGPVIGLDPVLLDDAGDTLAVDQELGANDGPAAARLIGALTDGPLLSLGTVEAATCVGHPAAPALGRGGKLLVHLLLPGSTAADSLVSGRGSGRRGSGCRARRRARRLHVVRLHRERGRRGRAALGLDRTGLDLRLWRFSWNDLGDDLGLGLGWLRRRRRLGSRLCLLGFGLRRRRSRDLRLLRWRRLRLW